MAAEIPVTAEHDSARLRAYLDYRDGYEAGHADAATGSQPRLADKSAHYAAGYVAGRGSRERALREYARELGLAVVPGEGR